MSMKERLDSALEYERLIGTQKFWQARSIYEKVRQFRDPTIICGDLNDTPNSRVYKLFSKRYENAFAEKGWGLGATFGEQWLLRFLAEHDVPGRALLSIIARDFLRIDHIFTSSGVDVASCRVVKDAVGSDHKPVVAVISLGSGN